MLINISNEPILVNFGFIKSVGNKAYKGASINSDAKKLANIFMWVANLMSISYF